MNYTLLIYVNETQFYQLSREEQNRVHEACGQWHEEIIRKGYARTALGLKRGTFATTVRRQDGQTLVTDGPFAETREVLGGLESIECPTYEEALDLAKRFPGLDSGGSVEIRPEVVGGKCVA